MRILLPLLALACGQPDAVLATDPALHSVDDQAPPPLPMSLTLQLTDPLVPGAPVRINVTGATPNRTIQLVWSNGLIAPGPCPPQLGGACMSISQGVSGLQLIPLRTNAAGAATLNSVLPPTLRPGSRLAFQAVDPSVPAGSAPVERVIAAPACADDVWEDNDAPGTATINPALPTFANACEADLDHYSYVVPPGQQIEVSVTYDPVTDGDVDLVLLDAATGAQLDASTSAGDIDTVTWINPTANPTTVIAAASLVDDVGGPSGAEYEVLLSFTPNPSCTPDRLEPNDTSAAAIPRAPGTYNGLTACLADRWDWYLVSATAGQTVEVTAMHDYSGGDIDVYATTTAQPNDLITLRNTAIDYGTTTFDDETVSFVAPATQSYWIGVYLWGDGGGMVNGNLYNLDVSVQ